VNRLWRWAPWMVLVAVVAALLAIGSHRSSHPTLDARVMHIANEVRCPVCNGETAAQSSAPASVQIRTEIRQELEAGQTSNQILAGLVRAYGSGILEKPQSTGVGLIVWVAPVVATVLAAAVLVFAFIRWRRRASPDDWRDEEESDPAEATVGAHLNGIGSGARPERAPTVGADSTPGPVPASVQAGSVTASARAAQGSASVQAAQGSLDEALTAVVVPAAAVASVQSTRSSAGPAAVGVRSASLQAGAGAVGSGETVGSGGAAAPVGLGEAVGSGGAAAPVGLGEAVETRDAVDTRDAGAPAGRRVFEGPRWLRAALIGLAVCLIAGGAGWAVAASSNTRLPGQTITGQALGSQAIAEDMQTAQADAARGNAVAAIKEYQKILRADPNQVDALTGEGWLLVQTAEPSLLQQGIGLLGSAEQSDPSYPPAHLYRGLAFLGEADYSDAIPEFQWYLGHNPDPTVGPEVRQDLREAQAAAATAKAPTR
jgi:cytochrome c-type biogenesis protein CcmH